MSTPQQTAVSSSKPEDPVVPSAVNRAIIPFYILAFCSGVAALCYEVAWARMLALTFGSATLAAAAVIAGFMGGMGLGAWLYHFVKAHRRHPVLVYAALEFGIAVSTAVLSRSFYHLPGWLAKTTEAVGSDTALAVIRFAWIFAILIVPACLMGATFPALCAVMIRSVRGVDRHLGRIYGINTLGAAAGALLSGLFLIEHFGLTNTVNVANLLNIGVGVAALILARTVSGSAISDTPTAESSAIPTELSRGVVGVVLLGSGCATMCYEVLWFRSMRSLIGNSTHALTIILVVFLCGLGLGSLLLERVVRRGRAERDLAMCQCLIAVLAMVAMGIETLIVSVPSLREYVSVFSPIVRQQPWWWRLILDAAVAAFAMLPATVFMGLSFPLSSRLFLGDIRGLGRQVGGAYLLANIGSILGSLLAALLLLEVFSTIGGTKLVAGLNLLLGLVILWRVGGRRRDWGLCVAAMVLVAAGAVALPRSLGKVGFVADQPGSQLVFSRDDDLATVQVIQDGEDVIKRTMTVNGCQIGWSWGYSGTRMYQKQVVLAHLPMLLDSRIRTSLNVGLGSAATLYALASYSEMEVLDCVEISPAVVEASHLFPESAVLDDPRVNVIVDDVVHFLLRAGRQYDLIISDGKLDPFHSGNATLLCKEFYEYARSRLTEHGMFIQWLPLGTLHSDVRINLRTFCDVFPEVEVFFLPPASMLVLGAQEPFAGRPRLDPRRLATLPKKIGLSEYFLDNESTLLACSVADRAQLQSSLGAGMISRWDHLYLDFSAFKANQSLWNRAKIDNLELLLRAERAPRKPGTRFSGIGPLHWTSAKLTRQAVAAWESGRTREAQKLLQKAILANPADRLAKAMFTSFASRSIRN